MKMCIGTSTQSAKILAMSEDIYTAAILEEVREQNKRILDALNGMSSVPVIVSEIKADVSELKFDVKDIKSVVKDHSKSLQDHDGRLALLEAA